jgi:hypothetical protein
MKNEKKNQESKKKLNPNFPKFFGPNNDKMCKVNPRYSKNN